MAAVNFFRVVVLVHFVLFIWSLTQPLWESGSYSTLGVRSCERPRPLGAPLQAKSAFSL
jgi:hypothetical protein